MEVIFVLPCLLQDSHLNYSRLDFLSYKWSGAQTGAQSWSHAKLVQGSRVYLLQCHLHRHSPVVPRWRSSTVASGQHGSCSENPHQAAHRCTQKHSDSAPLPVHSHCSTVISFAPSSQELSFSFLLVTRDHEELLIMVLIGLPFTHFL